MKYSQMVLLLSAIVTTGIHGVAKAEGLYGTAMIGKSDQSQKSEAYGNNIAVDPTFPNQFSTGDGNVGTIGVGYSFNSQFRIEGRLSHRNGDFDSKELGAGDREGQDFVLNGDIKSTALTIEGFYDFPTQTAFKPYIKAGVGVVRNRYSARLGGTGVAGFFDSLDGTTDGYYDDYADKRSTELTWNVGAGISYAINKKLSLIGEYQYVTLGDAGTSQDDFTDGFRVEDASVHEVQIGIQYNF